MPMTYTSLIAPKGTTGSIANWVGFGKLDIPTILEEAQSLIFSMLRVREMRTEWIFGMGVGASRVDLPDRFLDPIGRIRNIDDNTRLTQFDQPVVEDARMYEQESGTLGTNPFTTLNNSSIVTVALANHGLTQDSTFNAANTAPVAGLDLDNAFPIIEILDANTFEMDVGALATSSATGGGSGGTWTANRLIDSIPGRWGIWDECVVFECAFTQAKTLKLPYFRQPQLLSATNTTNFLTNRYPKLIRVATTAAAAEMMKDDEEFQKGYTSLSSLVQSINAENDMFLRGAEFGTDTPTPGDYY